LAARIFISDGIMAVLLIIDVNMLSFQLQGCGATGNVRNQNLRIELMKLGSQV